MAIKKTEQKALVTTPTVTVDETAITKKAADLSTEITAIVVKDQESYTLAAQSRTKIKQYTDWLEGFFGPSKKALNAALTTLRNEEKRLIGPRITFANGLLEGLNRKMEKWLLEEDTRKRKEAEEKRIAEEKRVAAEKKKLETKAAKAEENGKDAQAEQLRMQAKTVVAAPVTVEKTSLAGTGTMSKDDIAVEIVDTRLFLKYLMDMGAPVADMIEFKYAKVKEYVKEKIEIEKGEEVQKAPGITVTKRKIIGSRG